MAAKAALEATSGLARRSLCGGGFAFGGLFG